MNMNVISEKRDMFRAAIDKQAEDEISELTAKIRAKKNAAGKAKAELAVREELAGIHADRNAAEAKFKKEMSRCDFETARAVRVHRKELIDGFFEEIRSELSEFAKSDKYDGYLWNSLKKAEEVFGKDCVILASTRDVPRVEALTKNEVRADNSIKLGGICAMDEKKGLFVDLSMDNALEDEMEQFSKKAELRL